jgi:hypothetical protein
MALGVIALKPAEVITRGSIEKAIGVTGGDVKRIQDPQPVLQIAQRFCERSTDHRGQFSPGAAEAMAPGLLAMVQVQGHSWWPAAALTAARSRSECA